VADIAALVGQYSRAIDRFEAVARASLNSNLTKWSVKDYFFKAGACYLANKVRISKFGD
jgi:alpha-soluble NSF attachment protein